MPTRLPLIGRLKAEATTDPLSTFPRTIYTEDTAMNSSNFFNPDEALEHGQSLVKKQMSVTVNAVTSQVSGTPPTQSDASLSAVNQDHMTKDFLRDMYGVSPTTQQAQQPTGISPTQASQEQVGSDEQARLAEARAKLEEHKKQHMETYYKPTFESRPQQEERAQEKVEREEAEEQQKRWELQQEEKKKEAPIALRMATNKAEQFRGAAG